MQKNEIIKVSEKRKEIFLYAFALSLLFSFFALFPDVDLTIQNPKQPSPFASLVEKNNNAENIGVDEIYDDSPIFLPTRWNSTFTPAPTATPVAWNFEASDEKYATQLQTNDFPLNDNNDKCEHNFINRSLLRNAFSSYARAENTTKKQTKTISYSIIDLTTGKTIKSDSFESDLAGTMQELVEYKVSIEIDGWVMRPLALKLSGNEEVDTALENMLTKSKLLKQIPTGNYKIIFVP